MPFLALALGIAVVIAVVSIRSSLRAAAIEPTADAPPTAPIQRLALSSLLGGAVLAAAAAWLVFAEGPTAVHTERGARLLTTMIAFAAYLTATVPVMIATKRAERGQLLLDERDHAIIARAPRTQSIALMIVVLISLLALKYSFSATGAVPVVWMHLVFWIAFLTWGLAFPAGLLIGYHRS